MKLIVGVRRRRIQFRRFQRTLMLASLCTLLAVANPASAQDSKLASNKRAAIEIAVAKFMAAGQVPGLSAAVVENGEFVWSAGFGMADLENFVPATSQTLYRLASVSKPITSTAAMQLWEAWQT